MSVEAQTEFSGPDFSAGVSLGEIADEGMLAGHVASCPDPHTGERIRLEHWVVAERQGQTAARNILGRQERFDAVPFFWSNHYDVALRYVGHAERWDDVVIDGDLDRGDCTASFISEGRTLAVVTVGRDVASLHAEAALERGDLRGLEALAGR